ncbi:sensor histidine kinase [Flavobacterium sp.]
MGKTEYLLITILFNFMFLLFVVAIITYIWQYKKKKKESEIQFAFEKNQHQKELLNSQLEIQYQTMQEIGLEIHDNVGQKLTLASLYIHKLIYENKADEHTETMGNINNIITDSLADLRQLSKTLTDDSITRKNIVVLLRQECDKVHKIKRCTLKHDNIIEKIEISYHLKSMILRLSQEFIQNSLKHSECESIHIELTYAENKVILKLMDDGKGFDVSNSNSIGIGLQNMKKRVQSVGGKFILQSDVTGTQLILRLPLSL